MNHVNERKDLDNLVLAHACASLLAVQFHMLILPYIVSERESLGVFANVSISKRKMAREEM